MAKEQPVFTLLAVPYAQRLKGYNDIFLFSVLPGQGYLWISIYYPQRQKEKRTKLDHFDHVVEQEDHTDTY